MLLNLYLSNCLNGFILGKCNLTMKNIFYVLTIGFVLVLLICCKKQENRQVLNLNHKLSGKWSGTGLDSTPLNAVFTEKQFILLVKDELTIYDYTAFAYKKDTILELRQNGLAYFLKDKMYFRISIPKPLKLNMYYTTRDTIAANERFAISDIILFNLKR